MSQLFVTVATPAGPDVPRTFEVTGSLSVEYIPSNRGPLHDEFVTVQFGAWTSFDLKSQCCGAKLLTYAPPCR